MTRSKSLIILSEKSSGSSAFQSLLVKYANVRSVTRTRHFENETLYWTKAASVLGRPQTAMVDSEVPIAADKARGDLVTLLRDNVDGFVRPDSDSELVYGGWRRLCEQYAPVFVEKSPHHLCQWSAIELILDAMQRVPEVDFQLVGLIRNPMDTVYSQYSRWKSHPEKVERQWVTAYRNLQRLQQRLGERLVVVRYEDMVASLGALRPVFEFCGVSADAGDEVFMHRRSLQKWRRDALFGFSLSNEAVALAQQYGYRHEEMSGNGHHWMWPAVRLGSRSIYRVARPLKRIVQRTVKAAGLPLSGSTRSVSQ